LVYLHVLATAATHSLIRKTLKQGLGLADLQQALKHKEKRMTVILGGELDTFDLIVNTLTPNAD
jgi:hypothetical protein